MDKHIARPKVEQFRAPKRYFGGLDADTAARLITASADIAMVLDGKGVIRDLALGDPSLTGQDYQNWVGKPWIDTVTVESRNKIEELIAEAEASQPRWRQVNHPTRDGADIPIRYTAVKLGPKDRVVVVGRDLRSVASLQQRLVEAQQVVEREYEKLRQSETRYRLLFEVSSEAVLVVDATTLKISEVNSACTSLLNRQARAIVGSKLDRIFDSASARRLPRYLEGAASGQPEEIKLRLADGKRDVLFAVSLFRQAGSAHLLARMVPVGAGEAGLVTQRSRLVDVIEKLPDAFVVTDEDLRIVSANSAFLELAQAASFDQVRGESIDRWLGRQSVDVGVLFSSLREHGAIRSFSTVFRGQYGISETVEVAGAAVMDTDVPCFGLSIRVVQRRSEQLNSVRQQLPRSVEQLTGLVGQVSLKELVRESTDLIEKLCIEAALELTGDNRASAAELLGLSRQGLYSKLRRYGIDDGNVA
jgi:transcriptional regulator PpsR